MSFGRCSQILIPARGNDGQCPEDAVVLFGADRSPLCQAHFEFALTRVRKVLDEAVTLSREASRMLGGGG